MIGKNHLMLSTRRTFVLAACLPALLLACSGDEDPDATFTPDELATIRGQLGTLNETPPPDATNAVWNAPEAIALGKDLYFETSYSSTDAMSCAVCHDPDAGFQDARGEPTSLGVGPDPTAPDSTGRHAPTVINVAYGAGVDTGEGQWMFWDGRKDSLWSQALGPPESATEMGSSRVAVVKMMVDSYAEAYITAFGDFPADLPVLAGDEEFPGAFTPAEQFAINDVYSDFGKAIAAYESGVICRGGAFDEFWAEIADGADDSDALTPQEKEGLKVFIGKGACIACHGGPNFTDWGFHNIGIDNSALPVNPDPDNGRSDGIAAVMGDEFNCSGDFSDATGPCRVDGLTPPGPADLGAFKTPGLRCVSLTAPYMHTGTFATLEDVVEHYDRGGDEAGFAGQVSPNVFPLELTDDEKAALVAFLRTLGGEAELSAP